MLTRCYMRKKLFHSSVCRYRLHSCSFVFRHPLASSHSHSGADASQQLFPALSSVCSCKQVMVTHIPACITSFDRISIYISRFYFQPLTTLLHRAPHLCGAAHDTDPTRLSCLETSEAFFQALEKRYGPNPHLVSFLA